MASLLPWLQVALPAIVAISGLFKARQESKNNKSPPIPKARTKRSSRKGKKVRKSQANSVYKSQNTRSKGPYTAGPKSSKIYKSV